MKTIHYLGWILLLAVTYPSKAQTDSTLQNMIAIPQNYVTMVSAKINRVDKKLGRQTTKLLNRYNKQEARLLAILVKKDSAGTKALLAGMPQLTAQLQNGFLNIPANSISTLKGGYNAAIDTLKTTLKYLQLNGANGIGISKQLSEKLQQATGKLNILDGKFRFAGEIKKQLTERKALLQQQLQKFGLAMQLRKIEKATYYYGAYINEYKALLADRKKLERKVMSLLYKLPAFNTFIRENSLLAGIFKIPGQSPNPAAAIPTLPGIQTRAIVTNLMQTAIAPGGPNAVTQVKMQVQGGQAQLNGLKDKIARFGSADTDIPAFKPNTQKTKNFLNRLEYGANIQFGKANQFLPVTSDIALSLGYKINDKSSLGIAVSYKIGLGSGWNNLQLTSQGIGLRSYIEWKIKGNFFLSCLYEQNYNSQFKNIRQLKYYAPWQSTALIGLSKKLKLKGSKRTTISLLYDFLSYSHIPVTRPFVFRTGFNLK